MCHNVYASLGAIFLPPLQCGRTCYWISPRFCLCGPGDGGGCCWIREWAAATTVLGCQAQLTCFPVRLAMMEEAMNATMPVIRVQVIDILYIGTILYYTVMATIDNDI